MWITQPVHTRRPSSTPGVHESALQLCCLFTDLSRVWNLSRVRKITREGIFRTLERSFSAFCRKHLGTAGSVHSHKMGVCLFDSHYHLRGLEIRDTSLGEFFPLNKSFRCSLQNAFNSLHLEVSCFLLSVHRDYFSELLEGV